MDFMDFENNILFYYKDDGLSPVEKLEKYADGENIFNRQMVARTVLETLRQVLEDKTGSLNASSESCEAVMDLLSSHLSLG